MTIRESLKRAIEAVAERERIQRIREWTTYALALMTGNDAQEHHGKVLLGLAKVLGRTDIERDICLAENHTGNIETLVDELKSH